MEVRRGSDSEILRLAPRLLVNNNLAARDAVAAGLGIALLPRFQVAQLVIEGRLEEVLPGWSKPRCPSTPYFLRAGIRRRRFEPSWTMRRRTS
ncbi:LysR substrate-binding domain-containing protein [Ancylobacter oerskovii]|uniref:LysR substrate-binding domain-containing protein n=1 Tax=Ancylobacter oerskovii TaxID=459519 RepID=A0ABW4Z4A8_9HYPH